MRIAITRDDGRLSIMTTVDAKADIAAEVTKWAQATDPPRVAISWRIVDAVPDRRDFRAAWVDDGIEVTHDLDKARDIQRERLRTERKPLLEQGDMAQLKALVTKDDVAVQALEAEKQKLRDAPADPRIDAASTLDELAALTIAELTADATVADTVKTAAVSHKAG